MKGLLKWLMWYGWFLILNGCRSIYQSMSVGKTYTDLEPWGGVAIIVVGIFLLYYDGVRKRQQDLK